METTDGDILRAEIQSQSGSDTTDPLEQRIKNADPYADPEKTKPQTGPLERVRAVIKSFINRRVGPSEDPNNPQAILAAHERSARKRGTPALYDRVNADKKAERQRQRKYGA